MKPRKHRGRPLAEETVRLDIVELERRGLLRPGHSGAGKLPGWGLSVRVDLTGAGTLTWTVQVTDFAIGAPRSEMIRLERTRNAVGGWRWWLLCPATRRRVRVLFRPASAERFASRRVHGLTYASQRQSETARAQGRAKAALLRLGNAPGVRPRGMHATTYRRLLALIEVAR